MALTFTPITAGTTGKVIKEDKFTPEFIAEFDEAWEHLKKGTSVGLSVEFPTHEARENWFNLAVAYGRRQGVSVTRVKGTDSMNKDHGRLSFKMESLEEKERRVAEAAVKAQRVMVLKSYGVELSAGFKTPEMTAREDKVLAEHYAKTPAEQEKHLAAWMQGDTAGKGEVKAEAKPVAPKPGPVPAAHGHKHGE